MSVQALSWAIAVQTGSATRKAVLVSLANCHNHHSGQCNPKVRTVCAETELGDRTVRRALADLEDAGFITKVQTFRKDGSKGTNQYTLNMGAPVTAAGGGVTAAGHEPELEPSEETYVSSANAGDSVEKDPFDLLWDACEEYVCRAPSEKSPRGAYAKLVHEMFDVGVTPADVRRRARAYRKRFPTMELTVAALAKWGEELDRGKRTLTEGNAENGGHGDDGGVPSVSVLPPEENARRMRELAERTVGALDGAGAFLSTPAPSSASASPHEPPSGAQGEPAPTLPVGSLHPS